ERDESAAHKRKGIARCCGGNGGFDHCETSSVSFGNGPGNDADWHGGDGHEKGGAAESAAGQGAGSADQTAARDFPRTTEAGAGPNGHVPTELSDSRKRAVAGRAIRSVPLVSSGMARPGLVSVALPAGRVDRWRLLLLEQRLLVSGVGLRFVRTILCLCVGCLCSV